MSRVTQQISDLQHNDYTIVPILNINAVIKPGTQSDPGAIFNIGLIQELTTADVKSCILYCDEGLVPLIIHRAQSQTLATDAIKYLHDQGILVSAVVTPASIALDLNPLDRKVWADVPDMDDAEHLETIRDQIEALNILHNIPQNERLRIKSAIAEIPQLVKCDDTFSILLKDEEYIPTADNLHTGAFYKNFITPIENLILLLLEQFTIDTLNCDNGVFDSIQNLGIFRLYAHASQSLQEDPLVDELSLSTRSINTYFMYDYILQNKLRYALFDTDGTAKDTITSTSSESFGCIIFSIRSEFQNPDIYRNLIAHAYKKYGLPAPLIDVSLDSPKNTDNEEIPATRENTTTVASQLEDDLAAIQYSQAEKERASCSNSIPVAAISISMLALAALLFCVALFWKSADELQQHSAKDFFTNIVLSSEFWSGVLNNLFTENPAALLDSYPQWSWPEKTGVTAAQVITVGILLGIASNKLHHCSPHKTGEKTPLLNA